ncbi:MAG TPA: GNAT family N-acetyltransferase [Phycisphaerales bacterium]|nr:GNAT family N-acetyltransferase [Phycisphaerales bacterium]
MGTEISRKPRAHILLRAVEEGDLLTLYEHQRDPDSIRMAVVNPRSFDEFVMNYRKAMQDPRVTARSIVVNGEVVGHVDCFQMEGVDAVGYWIAKDHWGRGIATKAVALLLQEVTRRPVHARVAKANKASLRVLEKNGFMITKVEHAEGSERYPACELAHLILE